MVWHFPSRHIPRLLHEVFYLEKKSQAKKKIKIQQAPETTLSIPLYIHVI